MTYDLLLVDGNNRARAAHSHLGDGVAETFFGDIKKVVVEAGCKKVLLLWDHPDSANYRKKLFAPYKHKRQHDPEAEEAVATCVEAGVVGKFPFWWDEGYEADDLIASVIDQLKDQKILIYGSDKDLFRHLAANVTQLNKSLYSKDYVFMTPEKLVAKYGIRPEQWIDYYTLKGDSRDDIPGVNHIGESNALQLIRKFGSIEGVAMNCHQLGIQPHRAKSVEEALGDGTVSLMKQLVAPRIYSPLPQTVLDSIANWTNPWLK